ncbi:hypothetical protein SASPL_119020 [Salvia splendens]|uniref:GRAM domain-containing protein n=1 Tax=Salvia splendens TaxID=180675 RepID=A0A8X8Y2U8_SALSN|nr:hypothetical protein SASPL_119020 [Salvia splendens]
MGRRNPIRPNPKSSASLKTGPSASGTEGGFESLFKQIFEAGADEKLKKTFACYLSTTTGPVAGTLYLSTARVAFCNDRPLSFRAPSGQETWAYYKNPPQKNIHLVTVDGHEFWLMGFVNFEKASHHLLDSVSDYRSMQQHVPS